MLDSISNQKIIEAVGNIIPQYRVIQHRDQTARSIKLFNTKKTETELNKERAKEKLTTLCPYP